MGLSQMFVGAVLSALVAVADGVPVLRERRPGVLASMAGTALAMPVCWNSILNVTGAMGLFSHDLPFVLFPVSWQDTGSGVFTLAGAALLLMLGAGRNDRPRRVAAVAGLTALAALVVDVYFY
ncbi:hypothetical protein [Paenarthrobacter sp. PH39-S1]|uniref:hypothetical protein n=1 Tax=Paenarthrobacter sp. PH39-S1 TaxID=3046204 RepID=UPI0024B9423F|nr:hypothetical protein [Paenarthrobacter sp. PH39-S1]MDJ0358205.1 hypothetical protein [Paenarthrobacter sp. PH39-S1]